MIERNCESGNPFPLRDHALQECVDRYRAWITDPDGGPVTYITRNGRKRTIRHPSIADIEALRGKDLACYCPCDGQPCHGDVLLELANR